MSDDSLLYQHLDTPSESYSDELHDLEQDSLSDEDLSSILEPEFLGLHAFNANKESPVPPILNRISNSIPSPTWTSTPPLPDISKISDKDTPSLYTSNHHLSPIKIQERSQVLIDSETNSLTCTVEETTKMEKFGKCREFYGYPQDNAKRFLEEFESYVVLNDLTGRRRIAAFHLHLKGPALSWYSTLSDESKASWDVIVVLFKEKYVNFNWRSSTVMVESEVFQNLELKAGQNIDDYYSSIVDKGAFLKKPDHELLTKFITGLPRDMAFFVRAGHPADIQAALVSAKVAETSGYRDHGESVSAISGARRKSGRISDPVVEELKEQVRSLTDTITKHQSPVSSPHTPKSELQELQDQVKALSELVLTKGATNTKTTSNDTHSKPQAQERNVDYDRRFESDRKVECFRCKASGHMRNVCNWDGYGPNSNDFICQICKQNGHEALSCRMLACYQQGNRMNPMEGHNPPGRKS